MIGIVLTGCAAGESSDEKAVSRYCQYGAVSEAQFIGCTEHVGIDRVLRSQTEAGRYAVEELTTCGAESGPLCPGIDLESPPEP